MIILADVPYLDAFEYAKNASQNKKCPVFYNDEDLIDNKGFDIFDNASADEVAFVSNLSSDSDMLKVLDWSDGFKVCVFWNCKFEKLKKILSQKNVKFKEVSIPQYVSISSSIEKIKKDINSNFYQSIVNESRILPLPEKISRDIASSLLHKIAIINGERFYNYYYSDIVGKVNFSFIDITDVFCKNAEDFFKFCNYYFDRYQEEDCGLFKAWLNVIYCLSISNFDLENEKVKDIKYLSPRVIQVINDKISNIVKPKNAMFFNYAFSNIIIINELENLIVSMTLLRKSIESELDKKITINIIRSFNE